MGKQTLKLGIIGCGIVVEKFHLPASKLLPEVEVVYLADVRKERAEAMARLFNVSYYTTDYRDMLGNVDAVLIATPHFTHAPISVDCLRHGIHVLCEKPIATSSKEAREMIQTAEGTGYHLGIGMVRRVYPATMHMSMVIKSGILGSLEKFEVQEGLQLTWEQKSFFLFDSKQSGGGVLISVGIHALDLLLYLIGNLLSVDSYEDDNLGTGWEANAYLDLTLCNNGLKVPGTVEISFMRNIPFILRLYGTKGRAELRGSDEIRLFNSQGELVLEKQMPETQLYSFAEQLRRFCASILDSNIQYVTGEDALRSLELVEACYRQRKIHLEPYEVKYLDSLLDTASSYNITEHSSKKVLVTGATGFMGCRLVERLVAEGYSVRAMVHNLDKPTLPRLSRFPFVEIVVADLLQPATLAKAIHGCSAVIHCAYGSSVTPKQQRRVTVEGTQSLLAQALQAGVKRFVHISTIAVLGEQYPLGTHDDSPYKYSGKNIYIDSKIDAEKAALSFYQHHQLPVVVIRPASVYGPYSNTWAVRIVDELKQGRVLLPEGGDFPANIVYIDNLIDAILLAIESDKAVGQAFNIVDVDDITWKEFYSAYASLLPGVPGVGSGRLDDLLALTRKRGSSPLQVSRKLLQIFLKSSEVRTLLMQTSLFRRLYQMMPGVFRRIKEWSNRSEEGGLIQHSNLQIYEDVILGEGWLKNYATKANLNSEKAMKVLGYCQHISFHEGVELTYQWLEHMKFVPSRRYAYWRTGLTPTRSQDNGTCGYEGGNW